MQQSQTLFTQEATAFSKSIGDASRETFIELCGSISECETAAKGRLDRLVGGDFGSSRICAAVRRADWSGGANEAGSSK